MKHLLGYKQGVSSRSRWTHLQESWKESINKTKSKLFSYPDFPNHEKEPKNQSLCHNPNNRDSSKTLRKSWHKDMNYFFLFVGQYWKTEKEIRGDDGPIEEEEEDE